VELAAIIASQNPSMSARDSIHAAVMRRLGLTRIITADGDFKDVPGIERLDPMRIDEWRDSIDR
jgi:predicted nucleic acid-binding protein